jgi:hypothetical protein
MLISVYSLSLARSIAIEVILVVSDWLEARSSSLQKMKKKKGELGAILELDSTQTSTPPTSSSSTSIHTAAYCSTN